MLQFFVESNVVVRASLVQCDTEKARELLSFYIACAVFVDERLKLFLVSVDEIAFQVA